MEMSEKRARVSSNQTHLIPVFGESGLLAIETPLLPCNMYELREPHSHLGAGKKVPLVFNRPNQPCAVSDFVHSTAEFYPNEYPDRMIEGGK